MGAVIIEVTGQAVKEALGLPEGVEVTGADFDSVNRVVVLRLDTDGFPGVVEGARPELVPVEDLEKMRVSAQRRAA